MNKLGIFQAGLQALGRALMLPIAVLPVAALMLRLGQPDLLDQAFIAAAGQAIFAQIGLLFAIGVGVGIAKANHGAAGLAGAVSYLVVMQGAKLFIPVPDDLPLLAVADPALQDAVMNAWRDSRVSKLSVPAGIISGLAAGVLYNRFHTIKLPEYLSFFGGRRFVPIAAGCFGLVAAAALGLGFAMLESAIDTLSEQVTAAGSAGLFAYGLLNRLLLVTGLHHILNNLAWFVVGNFEGMSGDLNRFFAGDPSAGMFMAGFFPVMMFGLPGACLAMWQSVPQDRRKAATGIYVSMALTSFLTGVTEPVEFTFMFIAPLLYVFHAVMTGVSMIIMDALNIRLGFGFSAGFFDYVLNYPLGTNPALLLPVGIAYFAIYYTVFLIAFRRFGIAVPGSELSTATNSVAPAGTSSDAAPGLGTAARGSVAMAYIAALGGQANLAAVDACTTRLRLVLDDPERVDADALRRLGAKGTIRLGAQSYQVVIGPDADRLADEIRSLMGPGEGRTPAVGQAASPPDPASLTTQDWLPALGGAQNIASFTQCGARTVITVKHCDAVRFALLETHFHGRWIQTASGAFHLIPE